LEHFAHPAAIAKTVESRLDDVAGNLLIEIVGEFTKRGIVGLSGDAG